MPREARQDYRGALQHVCMRGIERRSIFVDDADRERFVGHMEKVLVEAGNPCLAWALMPNHVHLLLETRGTPLPGVMRRLGTRHATAFNKRHGRVGHLFQNRYSSRLVERDDYVLTAACYIFRNPLRAGIVPDLAALEVYPWTGYPALLGGRRRPFEDVEGLYRYLDGEPWQAMARLKARMAEEATPPEALAVVLPGRPPEDAGGAERLSVAARRPPDPTPGDLRNEGWDLDRLIVEVARVFRVPVEDVRSGSRLAGVPEARAVIGHLGHERLGYSLTELGVATGVGRTALSKSLRRGRAAAEERGILLLPSRETLLQGDSGELFT